MDLNLTMATSVTALLLPNVCVDHERIDLMNLTAARPLLDTRTLMMMKGNCIHRLVSRKQFEHDPIRFHQSLHLKAIVALAL